MSDIDNVHSLAAPFALDALDELERRRFEAHLDSCVTCRDEVEDYLAVAAELGMLHEEEVSEALRASVGDIPRTVSGKITEIAITDVIHGREVKNREALANPEALDLYKDLPELQS